MNEHPYLLAIGLATTTLTGIVGMMVVDGYWDFIFLLMAVAALFIGGLAYVRNRSSDPLRGSRRRDAFKGR